MKKYIVLGMRKILKIREPIMDHNGPPYVSEEYQIILEEDGSISGRWILHLALLQGLCTSGYTDAQWACVHVEKTKNRGPITHAPKGKIFIDINLENIPSSCCVKVNNGSDYLVKWDNHGDHLYPYASLEVNEELFVPTGRGHQKPLVWVFQGASNLGKSTIAGALPFIQMMDSDDFTDESFGFQVYETDTSDKLSPRIVYASVIVCGNKYQDHNFEAVKDIFDKLKLDVELVPVKFG